MIIFATKRRTLGFEAAKPSLGNVFHPDFCCDAKIKVDGENIAAMVCVNEHFAQLVLW